MRLIAPGNKKIAGNGFASKVMSGAIIGFAARREAVAMPRVRAPN
jgi:hypothetical protein